MITRAYLFATRESKDRLAEFKEYTWTKDSLIEMTKKGFMSKFTYLFMRKVYRNHPIVIPEIKEVYGKELDIDLGGRTVRLIKTKHPTVRIRPSFGCKKKNRHNRGWGLSFL